MSQSSWHRGVGGNQVSRDGSKDKQMEAWQKRGLALNPLLGQLFAELGSGFFHQRVFFG